MNEDHIARWLDGDLSRAEDEALAAIVARDPQVALALRQQVVVAAQLESHLGTEQGAGATARAVMARISGAGDPRRMALRVVRRIRKRRRHGLAWGALAATVLVASAWGWLAVAAKQAVPDRTVVQGPVLVLESVVGQVRSRPLGGGDEVVMAAGSRMADGLGLHLGVGASATLSMPDASQIDLSGPADFATLDIGAGRLRLDQGTLAADVQPRPAETPLRITTRDAEAVVVGTRLRLVSGAGTTLQVDHGLVRLVAAGGYVEVPALFAASVKQGQSPGPVQLQGGLPPPGGVIEDASAPGRWITSQGSASRIIGQRGGPGPSGIPSLAIEFTEQAEEWAWIGRRFEPFLDLSGGSTIVLTLRRAKPDLGLELELTDAAELPGLSLQEAKWMAPIPPGRTTDWERISIPMANLRPSPSKPTDRRLDPSRIWFIGVFGHGTGRVEIAAVTLGP